MENATMEDKQILVIGERTLSAVVKNALQYVDATRPALRPVLASVQIRRVGNVVQFTATDSYVLLTQSVEIGPNTISCTDDFECLVGSDTLKHWLKILGKVDQASLTHVASDSTLELVVSSTTAAAKVVEGTFPAWEQLMPSEIVFEWGRFDAAKLAKLGKVEFPDGRKGYVKGAPTRSSLTWTMESMSSTKAWKMSASASGWDADMLMMPCR
jgi:DNA polymerase III sliding clamp (beta) subunit (PCNA family)